jgi:hypothetical protein
MSNITTKEVQSLLVAFFGPFTTPSEIRRSSLLVGIHGLGGFYDIVISPFLDNHTVSTAEFSHKKPVLSLLCQSLKAWLEAEAILVSLTYSVKPCQCVPYHLIC